MPDTATVTGVIEAANSRPGKGGFQHGYRINGEWYNLGFQKNENPTYPKGATITAEYKDYNGRKYLVAKSIKVDGTSASSGRKASAPRVDDRQDAIMRQNAMAHAAVLVSHNYAANLDPVDAAELVVRLAAEVFFPYAAYGKNAVAEEENTKNNQREESEEPNDDIPF